MQTTNVDDSISYIKVIYLVFHNVVLKVTIHYDLILKYAEIKIKNREYFAKFKNGPRAAHLTTGPMI